MTRAPSFFDVPVSGGELRAARWGDGPRTVLAIHGITGSALSFASVARLIPDDYTLLAPDLRGRGGSADLPGPYGMRAHADDCAAVIEDVRGRPVVVVGHSMGAYVAATLAAHYPHLVERVLLVDGGLPAAVPGGVDPDQILEAVLGPALARLRQTFPSRDAYVDFWRGHPAFQEWNDDVTAYVDYDVREMPDGAVRSAVSEKAVREDGTELVTGAETIGASLEQVKCPMSLLRAPRNLLDQPTPLLPDDLVESWRQRMPGLTDEMIEDTNHYTIVLGRGAGIVADRIRSALPPAGAG